jgi:hypothetical protein
MSKIPTQLTAKEFARHVEPHLSKARRGFICKIPLFKVDSLGNSGARYALICCTTPVICSPPAVVAE